MPFDPLKKGQTRRVMVIIKGPRDADQQNKLRKALRQLQKQHKVDVPKAGKA